MNEIEIVKTWVLNSPTYKKMLIHRQTCDKQRRGKFCIDCRGGGWETAINSFKMDYMKEMKDSKTETETLVPIVMAFMRLESSLNLPDNIKDKDNRELINFIKDITGKDQSEELEVLNENR